MIYYSTSKDHIFLKKNIKKYLTKLNYNFSYFSVRLGSKHNVRASILASSLCLDSASLRAGSIKSHSIAGSVIAHSLTGRSLSEGRRPLSGGPPSLVIHSSSGVSSGSTSSDTASNEDKNAGPHGPHSPTPSSSSSQGTVKRSPHSGANSVISSSAANSTVLGAAPGSTPAGGNGPNGTKGQVRPRHLKQRKEVFKGASSINGEFLFFVSRIIFVVVVDELSVTRRFCHLIAN